MNIDLGVMPSYECNLECWFCMYECGPDKTKAIDLTTLEAWLANVDWNYIKWLHAFGGEPSINIPLYDKVFALFPKDLPKGTTSNGSWSMDKYLIIEFLSFISRYHLYCIVSSTPEHKKAQDIVALGMLHDNKLIEYKKNDDTKGTLLPMGRLQDRAAEFKCNKECLSKSDSYRVGITPSGSIIFQSCKGVYPVISDIREPFSNTLKGIEALLQRVMSIGPCSFNNKIISEKDQHTDKAKTETKNAADKWKWIDDWSEKMFKEHGEPPQCPTWLQYAYFRWYGADNPLKHSTLDRDGLSGPETSMIQTCSLALIKGPDVFINRKTGTLIEKSINDQEEDV